MERNTNIEMLNDRKVIKAADVLAWSLLPTGCRLAQTTKTGTHSQTSSA